jgi:hypothetical protein
MASNAALAPVSASEKVEEAFPVAEVMNPTLTVVGVTPGALAVLAAFPPAEVVDPPALVVLEVLLELLPHPVATSASTAPAASAARRPGRFTMFSP